MRRDIISGHFEAGQKLRTEHLKSRYEVGAGTLREAMAQLVADALVVWEAQRGFYVSPVSIEDLEDLTRMRVLLECEAVRDSINVGGDEWEAAVVSAFHRLSLAEQRLRLDPSGAFEGWEACNRQFHDALVAACGSQRMRRTRAVLYQQAEKYRRLSTIKGPPQDDLHDEHRAILEAVLGRNVELASGLLTKHINRSLIVIKQDGLLG